VLLLLQPLLPLPLPLPLSASVWRMAPRKMAVEPLPPRVTARAHSVAWGSVGICKPVTTAKLCRRHLSAIDQLSAFDALAASGDC